VGWVGWGQKVIPRPSADYFVVGRRQKVLTISKENRKGEKHNKRRRMGIPESGISKNSTPPLTLSPRIF
jgi:hypothetical protein